MQKRATIPKDRQTEVLRQCRRRCCLCFGLGYDLAEKHGQIAHLDGDRSNNALPNLVFLCLEHHDRYDGRTSQSKGISADEVRHWRDDLVRLIQHNPAVLQQPQRSGNDQATQRVSATQTGRMNIVAGRDVVVTNKHMQRVKFTPGPQHITEKQARQVQDMIKGLAELEGVVGEAPSYGKWQNMFKKKFHLASYRALERGRFEEAVEWLQQQRALLRPKLRRKNNETWRKELYGSIYARAGELGIGKEEIYALAFDKLALRKRITSLTELGERNLERLSRLLRRLPGRDS